MPHIMATKTPQNVHRKHLGPILMTFTCNIKINTNMCEPHMLIYFFVNLLQSPAVWLFDIFLTHPPECVYRKLCMLIECVCGNDVCRAKRGRKIFEIRILKLLLKLQIYTSQTGLVTLKVH